MEDFEITFDGFEVQDKPATGFVHYRWPSGTVTSVGLYRDTEARDLWFEVAAAVVAPFLSGREDVTGYYVGTRDGELTLLPVGKRYLVADAAAEIMEIDETDFETPVHFAVDHFFERGEVTVRVATLSRDCEISIDPKGLEYIELTFVTAVQGVFVATLMVPLQPLIDGESLTFPVKGDELRLLAPKVLPMAFRRACDPLGHIKPAPGRAGFTKAQEGVTAPLTMLFNGEIVEMRLDPALGDIYIPGDIGHVLYVSPVNAAAVLGGFSFSTKVLFETSRLDMTVAPPPPGADVFVTTLAASVSYNLLKPRPERAGLTKAEQGTSPLMLSFSAESVEMRLDPSLGDIYAHDEICHVFYVTADNPAMILGGFSFSAKVLFETSRLDMTVAPPPPGADVFVTTLAATISYNTSFEDTQS